MVSFVARGGGFRLPLDRLAERHAILAPLALLIAFVLLSTAFRPLLAPDETRYLTAAWEMWTRGNFIVPTVNGALYDQKPPLLFWLIDLSWMVLGVSRESATVVVAAISASVMLLTRRLALDLWPDAPQIARRVCWVMLGSIMFVAYGGLILFDLLVTACVLTALILLLRHARQPDRRALLGAGLAIGLGILAKGPVTLIFVLLPVVSYPLWRTEREVLQTRQFLKASGLALLVAILPVAVWLVPLAIETRGALIENLVWGQMAGRISGSTTASHARPFWFFLPLLPLFALPWVFAPPIRQMLARLRRNPSNVIKAMRAAEPQLRLLGVWIVGAVLIFSAISGKQPHYLVPLIPAFTLLFCRALEGMELGRIAATSTVVIAIALGGQAIAQHNAFRQYDLRPIAAQVGGWHGPVGVVGSYQGELGFLARLERPLEHVTPDDAAGWLARNPQGMLISLDRRGDQSLPGRAQLDQPYKFGHRIVAAIAP